MGILAEKIYIFMTKTNRKRILTVKKLNLRTMKKLLIGSLILFGFTACTDSEPVDYTANKIEYQLFQSSDFSYSGTLEVIEKIGGKLEFNINLAGAKGNATTSFPTHLHFGNYEQPEAVIAAVLQPVNSASLSSKTVLSELSDGTTLDFEKMKTFDGHIKIHLAADGPEYQVILVSGNIGTNNSSAEAFDPLKIAVCGNNF
jgi:hypothetical protein